MIKGYLEFPAIKHEASMRAFIQAMKDENNPFGINGAGSYGMENTYQQWIAREKKNHLGIELQNGYVPATEFLYVVDGVVVGCINIRHCLNEELLRHGGHIGYSIHPSYRRQGHATRMLQEALKYCKQWDIFPVLVTCHKDNIASRKTIEKCGG